MSHIQRRYGVVHVYATTDINRATTKLSEDTYGPPLNVHRVCFRHCCSPCFVLPMFVVPLFVVRCFLFAEQAQHNHPPNQIIFFKCRWLCHVFGRKAQTPNMNSLYLAGPCQFSLSPKRPALIIVFPMHFTARGPLL